MYGRVYLPMFLLRVGLFTLIKIHSFIAQAKSFSSLVTCGNCPVWWNGDHIYLRCLKVFFEPFTKCSRLILLCIHHNSPVCCICTNILSHFLYLVLILRCYQKVPDCFVCLEICLDAIPTTNGLNTFVQTLYVRYNYVSLDFIGWFCVVGDVDVIAGLVLL